MRIKLIIPTVFGANERLLKTPKSLMPNLAIAYLAGMIPARHHVSLVDDSVEEMDFKEPVDLVGITTTSMTAERAYRIGDIFRARGVPVVMGGIHASFMPEEALQHADAVVVGEAEDAWPQLLADFENGTMERMYQFDRRDSIDNLPIPRFDLVKPQFYSRLPFRKSIIFPVQTSRGCPHNCDFCSVTRFWGSKMRYRPIGEVIEEMKRSGGDTFFFTDDNLLFNVSRAEELLKALIPLRIKYICQADTRIHRHPELVGLLKQSGCFMTFIGLESLSKDSLNSMHKGFNKPEQYGDLFAILNKHDINVNASFVFGNEGDTEELARETADLLVKEKISNAMFFPLTPFPGTETYTSLRDAGRLRDEHWWLRQSIFRTLDQDLIKYEDGKPSGAVLRGIAMSRFYTWPSIARRFSVPGMNRLMCLPMNIGTKRKMDKYGVVAF